MAQFRIHDIRVPFDEPTFELPDGVQPERVERFNADFYLVLWVEELSDDG